MAMKHRPHLDGLRGVAVLAVVAFHCSARGFANGYLGVDSFFVLSGFLITSILLRELHNTGSISVLNFYARRARRLLPAFTVMALCVAWLYRMLTNVTIMNEIRGSFVAASTYVENFYMIQQDNDYWASEYETSPVRHCWSLSIEEQFYLTFAVAMKTIPILVLGRLSGGCSLHEHSMRKVNAVLLVLMVSLIAASLSFAAYLHGSTWASPTREYMDPFARGYQLLSGCLLSVWLNPCKDMKDEESGKVSHSSNAQRKNADGTGLLPLAPEVILALLALLYVSESFVGPMHWYFGGVGCTLLTTALIYALELQWEKGQTGLAGRVLSSSVLVFVGRCSYSMYLWHFPVILLGEIQEVWFIAPSRPLLRVLVVTMVSLAVAAASRRFVEQPIMRVRISSAGKFALGGVLTSAICSILVVCILYTPATHVEVELSFSPYEVGRVTEYSTEGSERVTEGVLSSVAPEGVLSPVAPLVPLLSGKTSYETKPILELKRSQTCFLEVVGSSFTVLLLGDSHARLPKVMWIYAAREHGFTLHVCSRSGSPAVLHPKMKRSLLSDVEVVQYVHDLQPNVTIVHNYSYQHPGVYDGAAPKFDTLIWSVEEYAEPAKEGIRAWYTTVFEGVHTQLFWILPPPYPPPTTMFCKRRPIVMPGECDFDIQFLPLRGVVVDAVEDIARTKDTVVAVDASEIQCPNGTCTYLLKGDTPLYSDHHVTAEAWILMSREFGRLLGQAGFALPGERFV